MITYLIADRKSTQLETVVFSAQGGDAVAVFTDPIIAEKYIQDAGWDKDLTVASLEPIDFLEWLIGCYRNGVRYMATDPDRTAQETENGLDTLDIEAHLQHAGQHINQVANREF